jgi:hypothetical protein
LETRLTAPLGFTLSGTPIYPVYGAAEDIDVEPDVEDEELDEDQDADPADDPEDGKSKKSGKYTPPDEKEWVRVQASLNRANASAKEKRLATQAAQRRIQELEDEKAAREAEDERRKLLADRQPTPSAPTPSGSGKRNRNQPDPAPQPPAELPANVLTPAQVRAQVEKAKREERETVAAEYLDIARRSAARVALSDARVPKESVGRLIRLIDLDEIELDASGDVVGGLDEQMAALREELPQLFAPAAPEEPVKKARPRPPRIPNASAADRPAAPEGPKSTAQQMADAILGGGR